MAVQVQFRRGNTSQHSTFTGAEGEITVNTEKDILVVHDGSTVGGHEVARVNNAYFNGNVDFSNATFSSNLIPSANVTYSLGSSTKRWANLYLSGNTIVIGDQSISSNSSTLILGNTLFSGKIDTTNLEFSGNLHPDANGVHNIGNGHLRWNKLFLSNNGISIGVANHTITTNSTTFIFTQNVTTNDSFMVIQGNTVGPVVNTSGFYGNVTANALNVGGDVTITGNLVVTGTTVSVNTTTLDVKDLNITIAKDAANSSAADGAGITIDGANATLTYIAATNTFNLSNYLKIGNSSVNTTINATSFTGDSATVGGNTASDLNTYANNKAANAYSNAVNYTDTAIGTANTAMAANAATAYTNAVSYTDSRIIDSVTNTSIAYAASANSVKNAYDRAIDANTRAASAQTEASSAYTNAASYADNKAANAYSNAISYTDAHIIDSVTNTSVAYAASANSVKNAYDRAIDANTRAASAQTEASAAYSNAVSYTDTKIGTANTAMAANAATAYSNAIAFASNASNVNTGTLAEARLPFRMDQDVRTTDTVQFNNLTLSGNLVVNGGVVTVTGNSVSFTDNMVYINQGISATITNIVGNGSVVVVTANNNYQVGWDVTITGVNPSSYNALHNNIIAANSTSFSFTSTTTDTYVSGGIARGKSDANPDLGFAAGYNDGSYHHAGFFRDASDGTFKVFDNYDPEPDASIFIDTSNTSFHIANFQANSIFAGNTSVNWFVTNTAGIYHTGIINVGNSSVNATINATSFTGTSNNTSFVGSVSAANVVSNAQLSANLSNYQTTAGLASNVATLNANNTSFLGGIAAASYIQNTDSRTLSGNLTFTGITTFSSNVVIGNTSGRVDVLQRSSNATVNVVSRSTTATQPGGSLTNYFTRTTTQSTGRYVETSLESDSSTGTISAYTTNDNNGLIFSYTQASAFNGQQAKLDISYQDNVLFNYSRIIATTANNAATISIEKNSAQGTYINTAEVKVWNFSDGANSVVNTIAVSTSNSVVYGGGRLTLVSNAAIAANGSLGSAGQVLTSGGTGNVYWTTPTTGTVTSVATGNGMTGGTITSTGTISVLANTGIVANATGLYVNSSYINTISSNSATFANSSATNTFTVGTASYFVANGNLGIGVATPNAKLQVEGTANVSGNVAFGGTVSKTDVEDTYISNTTASTTQTVIDSFSATTYRSAKYIIQATNGTSYHYTEVAIVHDGTTAYATEFATMFTGASLVSFAVDINTGNVRLLATAANATTTTYKIDRKLIKV